MMCMNKEIIIITSAMSSQYDAVPNTLRDEDKK